MSLLSNINVIVLTFLLAELVVTIIFTKDWKFRFSHVKKYPQLKPYAKTWKIVSVSLLLAIVILPILDIVFWPFFNIQIEKLGFYQYFLLFFALPIAYVWTEKRIVGRKWHLYDIIPLSISFISLIIALIVYFK